MAVTRHLKPIVVAASILAVSAHSGLAPAQSMETTVSSNAAAVGDEAAIRRVLASYSDALNGGKTAAVLPLYAEDGIIGFSHGLLAHRRLAVGRHEDAVIGVEGQHRRRLAAVERVVVGRQHAPDCGFLTDGCGAARDGGFDRLRRRQPRMR